MNFYEILKTKKLGRGSPDYWTQLFAEHVGGKGGWKVTELTDTLPITFRSNGTALINYRIYGTAEGAGETKNFVDITDLNNVYFGVRWYDDNGQLKASGTYNDSAAHSWPRFYVELSAGTYTISGSPDYSQTGVRLQIGTCTDAQGSNFIFLGFDTGSGYTFTLQTGSWVSIRVYTAASLYRQTIDLTLPPMLRRAETTPDFEPFGYKIPLVTVSRTQTKDTVIPIGDTKLMAGDCIDYESGKIFKAKRIHEDTVTIDGIVWDILDYDHDEVYKADGTRAKHTVTIQTHDIIDSLQYSARQAAFAFPNGLAAGDYKFTIGENIWVSGDVGKTLTFTLVNAIPAGGQLVLNGAHDKTLVGTTISVFASATDTTAAETVAMTEGDTGTDLGTIRRSKTDTVNSIDRALRGSNNWLESAMRQYLNSDKAAGSVWSPQTVFDRPPAWATTTAGFLNGKSTNFILHIGTAKKTTGLNIRTDEGRTAVSDEKIFLLSCSEVYMGDEYEGGEGTPYAYYEKYSDSQSPSTAADNNRIKYRARNANNWWLRSPHISSPTNVRLVLPSGTWSAYFALMSCGVAPACCIVLDDMDDWVKQTFYTETTVDLPAIETFNGENTLDSTETLGQVTIKGKIKPQS